MRDLRLKQFARITAQRTLEADEQEELDRLLYAQRQFQWRLPHRVVMLRAKLRALESQLLPSQAATVNRLQARVDRQRAARIERELKASTPPKGKSENV